MSADEDRPLGTVDERIDGEVLANQPGPEGRPRRWGAPVALATLLVLPCGLILHGARSAHPDERALSLLTDATVVATVHGYCPGLRRLASGDLDTHLLVGGRNFSLNTRRDQRARMIGFPVVGDRVRGLVEVRCPQWVCTTPELRPTAAQVAMMVIR